MNAAEKSGARRVCMRCVDRQRQINALRGAYQAQRISFESERERARKVLRLVIALAAFGVFALTGVVLWITGRAAAIGGAR